LKVLAAVILRERKKYNKIDQQSSDELKFVPKLMFLGQIAKYFLVAVEFFEVIMMLHVLDYVVGLHDESIELGLYT
jgi:hypothetical protein